MLQGWSEQLGDGAIQTAMDSGPPKMRRRFTAVPTAYTVALMLSNAQVDTLTSFWRDTLAMGSLKFDWKDPRSGAAATFSFAKTGQSSAPKIEAADVGVFKASFSLIKWP